MEHGSGVAFIRRNLDLSEVWTQFQKHLQTTLGWL